MVPLDELLRRKMLIIYLAIMAVLYALTVFQALVVDTVSSDVRGEVAAVALSAVGLLLALPTPATGLRYVGALTCMSAAPIVGVLFHHQLVAQIWSVVPLMFVAIFIRTWHSAATTRIAVAALTATAAAALLVAPAPIAVIWVLFYALSVLGAAEVFGLGNSVLLDAAFRDPLTLIWNRAGLGRQAGRLLKQADRRGRQIAVVVFDVDDFKRVNDERGHAVGDQLLSDLTRGWVARIPAGSVLGRIGGDEFVLIVAVDDAAQAGVLAAELTEGLAVDVTHGVAVGAPDPRALDGLFAVADRDLYDRKRARRAGNR
ncbi:GGDEF domain-containing protein [Mycolicibacterium vaccae]|uniref:Diguanylate cyclase n=1 Tax=Mycolicibacterium vaccae ATCC 25954 TaxID=1194972 RepID=K0UH07_MYCVA|nr:GGDEF domain-containing protein [Mycolicibacterium vaccae]ANI37617.1 diguanylate cyclase [Mycolicibacterium vaccae 95051]EJZ06141.1 diguanylate cyclase [Mycolicibacterium vaccae ATCC 25954]